MTKPDYDTTLAHIAGNIAAGLVSTPWNDPKNVARISILIAREIMGQLRASKQKADGTPL